MFTINEPLVSVIIPTYNSFTTVEICLESIKQQEYTNIEVIVVDNFSKDRTVNIAEKFGSKIFQISELRSAARNYGARKANGAYIIFIDADMQLTSKVIEDCVVKSINDNCDAIMIPEVRVGIGFWAQCRAVERLTYIGDPLIESARFFSRAIFEKINGFDESLEAGEDWDLQARLESVGCRIKQINSVINHHEGRLTLKKMILKRYYYGKTLMRYINKHPEKARVQFMPVRLNYVRHWRLLARYPLYTCGMLFMKAIEYFVTALSIISTMTSH
jgi:glycosyltransferase involved in cell wall biosynthesis